MRFVRHCENVENEEDDELGCFDDITSSRHDEAVLVQERCTAWIV